MRPDVVPGALSREYELSDHRGMRRTLSELQGGDPLVLVPPCRGFCPKDRRQHEGLLQPPQRDAGRLLPPRDDLDRQRHRDQWVSYCSRGPGGRFSRTPAAECRRRPTSRSIPRTQPDDSSHPCYWSHACVSKRSTRVIGSLAGRRCRSCAPTYGRAATLRSLLGVEEE